MTRATSSVPVRRLSGGVELREPTGGHARVWAPACSTIDLVLDSERDHPVPLTRQEDGFFEGVVERLAAGDRYWFRIDGDRLRPDPVSRWQPEGPHGPSAVVDPASFAWTDAGWPGLGPAGQVLYEMHVGTFTPEGSWAAAAGRLRDLKELGVTTIEMMPIADFTGQFGWGYDGVNLYAPTRLYGTPADLCRFIDHAHREGLAVILDVVYNHLGPDGNYLNDYSTDYFTDKYTNDWGRAINFEGPPAARALFVENAGYWIDEFHFDGLRFDATQDIKDASAEHVIAALARRAREAAGRRAIFLVAENEPQHTVIVRPPAAGGYGLDALWNDDYHHTASVALTGRREAYYTDYTGSAQEFVSSAKYGYLYQGQRYAWQDQPRGTPALDLPGTAFVHFLENHDQVANSAFGKRLHQVASPGRLRALTALTLLGPATPIQSARRAAHGNGPSRHAFGSAISALAANRPGHAWIASGVPVVTTASGAEGIDLEAVVVANDPERMASAAASILRDEGERKERGAMARRVFERLYTPGPATAPVAELYERMT